MSHEEEEVISLSDEAAGAAVRIQTQFRGFQARKEVEQLKYQPRRVEAGKYLKQHEVHKTLEVILSKVIFFKPDDPREFVINELKKIQQKKSTALITVDDLDTMFAMIDNTGKGVVTAEQVRRAFHNLNVPNADRAIKGDSSTLIDLATFRVIGKKHLVENL